MFSSKQPRIAGRSYNDIERSARKQYKTILSKTKRTPYVKSAYFSGKKVFLNTYWTHLNQKPRRDRKRRLKLYAAAIDLIMHSRDTPVIKVNPNGKNETVFRFAGVTSDGVLFYVQLKQNREKQIYFMSAFNQPRDHK